MYRNNMSDIKLLIPIVVLLGLVCFIACDPVPQAPNSKDEKKEPETKPQVPPEAPAGKSGGASGATSTPSPSSCGGLKGFLNLCEEKKGDEKPKQKRSLTSNEGDGDEDDYDYDKVEPDDVPEMMKRQISGNEALTPRPALSKREEPPLDATQSTNSTTDKVPAPLSSEMNLPVPHKREDKEPKGDDYDEDDVSSDENDDDDDKR